MKDLIEALQIFLKYCNDYNPTHCEHDLLWVNINPSRVTKADIEKLDRLSFFANDEDECFQSYRFGPY